MHHKHARTFHFHLRRHFCLYNKYFFLLVNLFLYSHTALFYFVHLNDCVFPPLSCALSPSHSRSLDTLTRFISLGFCFHIIYRMERKIRYFDVHHSLLLRFGFSMNKNYYYIFCICIFCYFSVYCCSFGLSSELVELVYVFVSPI